MELVAEKLFVGVFERKFNSERILEDFLNWRMRGLLSGRVVDVSGETGRSTDERSW